MSVWELLFDGINHYSVLVYNEETPYFHEVFNLTGQAMSWSIKPKVEPFIEKRKKKGKPRADISYLEVGAIVLNEKAYQALKDFLLPFGQLLELDCKGEIEYFYNVTNLISCIDVQHAEKIGNSVIKEVFLADAIPKEAAVFKDPHTLQWAIYLNQAGKEKFEQIAAAAGLFGARFVEAGQGHL